MAIRKNDFLQHLDDNGCHIDPDGVYVDGALYRNCLTGDMMYIEYDDVFNSFNCCHICYEFRIPAPLIFEDDYEIYKLYRKKVSYSQKKENEIFKKR